MSRATCERCGSLLPEGARFCPACGFPVGAPPPEERKVVTVMFVDLVGSTNLSSQLDPERYREVLATYYRTVAEELQSLRGRSVNLAGDAVVGVFGIPHAHDDDALRAVRASLALVERIGRVGEALDLPGPLQVRVGINTGPVAIGSESAEQGLLFGATVNLAARLQQAAEPGSVLVAETSWLLTKDGVEFGTPIAVEAKGFDQGTVAWPALALAPGSSRRTIPFVDRRRELRLLHDTFEGVRETSRGHLVTLLGEPGVGKSRVAEEFLAGLPADATALVGRASPFGEQLTLAPIGQMLLALLGEGAGTPDDTLRARLGALADACCPAEEASAVAARLGIALGLGSRGRGEGRYRVSELRSGLLSLVGGLAREGPVVLVLEDAHLADASLLDLVEGLVRAAKGVPVMMLCVGRYDLLDERPDWGGGLGDSLTMYLEPMPLEPATQLALEAGEGLDERTAENVARHAGGNPFFIVETTGMLLHEGGHLPSDTGPIPGTLLPPTVQAVIAARIDHLDPAARDLVRKASVFPRATFHTSELALIAEPSEPSEDVLDVLDVLEDEELLVRDDQRSGVWRFRHGLVRDVAYESLPKRERQRLHLRVANRFAEDETAARYPRTMAFHLEQAAKAALDLDPRDRTLAERAVQALTEAADDALWGSEAGPAADLYERALALSGPERTWGPSQAILLANLGEARYWLSEFESAVGPLTRALEIGGEDPRIRAQASRFLGDIELSIRADRALAGRLFDQALEAARELGDPWTLARTLLVAGWAPYWRNELETARAMFEEALEVGRANPEHDTWAEARALSMLAVLESEEGDEEESLSLASQALAIAEASADRFSIAVAHEAVGGALRRLWRLEEARPHLDAAVQTFRELGARWELASALTSRGILRYLARETEEAVGDLREAYRLCRDLNDRSIVTWTAGTLAKVLVDAGDTGAARQILDETAAIASASAEGADWPDWRLEAEVRILLGEGDRGAALDLARALVRTEHRTAGARDLASQVWWVAQVFGPEAVGGQEEVARARALLERLHAEQALREPDLVRR